MSQERMWTHNLHNHISILYFHIFNWWKQQSIYHRAFLHTLKMFSASAHQIPKLRDLKTLGPQLTSSL